MDAASTPSTGTKSGGDLKRRIIAHLSKNVSLWAWTAVLVMVNLPLLWGEVRTSLLFLPPDVAAGQWWRVITYPLVHLSWYHLLLDASGFLILYACLEEKRPHAKALYMIGPAIGSLVLALAMDPGIFQQGLSGLSGIAHGLMAVTALEMFGHRHQRRWGAISLALVVAKSAYELWSGHVVFEFMHMGLCGRPLAASHAGGVIGGVLTFLLMNRRRKDYVKEKTGDVLRKRIETCLRPHCHAGAAKPGQRTGGLVRWIV
jgi:rhomboid family GlyGly-CTERM serine protease